jgi:Ca2+-binding RTX toxin-like protein
MRRSIVLVVVGALLLSMFTGVAVAKTFQCTTVPCVGTNNDDAITERSGSVHDEIYGLDGRDRINAASRGDDADTVYGGPGNDTIFANDGDTRDYIDCGGGNNDTAYIDVFKNNQGNVVSRDTTVNCENVIKVVTRV